MTARLSTALAPALAALSLLATLTGCSAATPGPANSRPILTPSAADPRLRAATTAYRGYVDAQLASLVTATESLDRAVDAGELATARRRYPAARQAYERIEPAAELWGTLDLEIDGRANDVVAPQPFTGFHRLERGLWGARPDPALPAMADSLVARVRRLRALAAGTRYTVLQLTSGATELLDEIQANKITGEEERYSHLDLVDLSANIAGVLEVVAVLRSYLRTRSAALLGTIDVRAAVVVAELARHARRPGYDGSGYERFTSVSLADRRRLAADVAALAEPVALLTQATSA